VTAHADLDATLATLVAAKFGSAGQSCAAPSRLLVDRRVVEQFVERLVRRAPALDDEPHGTMGPLNNATRRDEIHALVVDAVRKGAGLRLGGYLPGGPGSYYPATVLVDVPASARIMVEEPFGPVAPVLAYDDENAAVAMANAAPYALSAYVFGETEHALDLGRRLDAGSVSVNCAPGAIADAPFGGRRDSGYGYEGGVEGLLAFGRLKVLAHAAATAR
jgi:succinate-semialdehyde dehydrogenase / glutarate-semialdehyde dehydrogenase